MLAASWHRMFHVKHSEIPLAGTHSALARQSKLAFNHGVRRPGWLVRIVWRFPMSLVKNHEPGADTVELSA